MAFSFPEINQRSLSGSVLDSLGSRIVRGDFKPGHTMTEADVAKEFDVSRSVVRDVIKTLTALRMVKAKPKIGIQLQPIENWDHFDTYVLKWRYETTPADVFYHQMMQIRLAFEPMACALAAQNASAEELANIKKLGKRLHKIHSSGEVGLEAIDIDMDFHMAINRASGNPLLLPIGRIIYAILDQTMTINSACFSRFADQHLKIMKAIIARDAKAAHAEMTAMLQNASVDTNRFLDQVKSKR